MSSNSENVSNLICKPGNSFIKSFTSDSIASTDVPRLVLNTRKLKNCRTLHTCDCITHVHFVCKKQNGNTAIANIGMSKQLIEFFSCYCQPQLVWTVDDKYNSMAVSVIMFPHVSISALPRHIKSNHLQWFGLELFHGKTDCRNYVGWLCFSRLKTVNYRCLATVVQTNHYYIASSAFACTWPHSRNYSCTDHQADNRIATSTPAHNAVAYNNLIND